MTSSLHAKCASLCGGTVPGILVADRTGLWFEQCNHRSNANVSSRSDSKTNRLGPCQCVQQACCLCLRENTIGGGKKLVSVRQLHSGVYNCIGRTEQIVHMCDGHAAGTLQHTCACTALSSWERRSVAGWSTPSSTSWTLFFSAAECEVCVCKC